MKAALYTAPGRIEIVDVPAPAPAPGDLLVRMETATICGSDLHYLADSPPETYPWKPGQSGHECIGTIESLHSDRFPPGLRVLVLPPGFDGFAEFILADSTCVIPLPDDLESERAVLAQQLGTVIYCCKKLCNVLGKVFVVIGQGPAGLLFTMLLRMMGARCVIGLDLVDYRLEVARFVGASHTVNVERDDPVEAVRRITDGCMADGVVEAVGKAETVNLCPSLVRQCGEVALFGVPKEEMLPVAVEDFLRKNVRLVASANAQGEAGLTSFRLAVELIASRRLDVSPLISHRLWFADIVEGFRLAEEKRDGAVKILLKFP